MAKMTRAEGSPPLARGTERETIGKINIAGITPACAGNSWVHPMKSMAIEDHPRLRGEQIGAANPCRVRQGSPPLARGTAICLAAIVATGGITPACAGNSNLVIYQCHKAGDHPRLRGEQPKI